jgi:hypothetical protein
MLKDAWASLPAFVASNQSEYKPNIILRELK